MRSAVKKHTWKQIIGTHEICSKKLASGAGGSFSVRITRGMNQFPKVSRILSNSAKSACDRGAPSGCKAILSRQAALTVSLVQPPVGTGGIGGDRPRNTAQELTFGLSGVVISLCLHPSPAASNAKPRLPPPTPYPASASPYPAANPAPQSQRACHASSYLPRAPAALSPARVH